VNTRTFQFSSLADLISSGSALVSFTLEAGDGDATPEGTLTFTGFTVLSPTIAQISFTFVLADPVNNAAPGANIF
ncbi:hypothetical protein, partial [Aphanothece stagnina]|uniref:hypothetical protein n=1 Tax=Aphanothece stagnina TaxID=1004305 RepID=UPI00398E9354